MVFIFTLQSLNGCTSLHIYSQSIRLLFLYVLLTRPIICSHFDSSHSYYPKVIPSIILIYIILMISIICFLYIHVVMYAYLHI